MEEFIQWEMLINLFSFYIILSFHPSIFSSALSNYIWIWLKYQTNKMMTENKVLRQNLLTQPNTDV